VTAKPKKKRTQPVSIHRGLPSKLQGNTTNAAGKKSNVTLGYKRESGNLGGQGLGEPLTFQKRTGPAQRQQTIKSGLLRPEGSEKGQT